MKAPVLASLWSAHRVLGTLLGTLLFVLFATGIVSVFRDELRLWSSPMARVALQDDLSEIQDEGERLQIAMQRLAEHHDLQALRRWAILLPMSANGAYEWLYTEPGQASVQRVMVRASDLQYLGPLDRTPADFIFNIHANLALRGRTGRLIVGGLGFFCLILVVTGILMHRHKLRDAFAWRIGANLRRSLGDSHRALGLWGAPFLVVVALSGAAIGLKSLLVVAPAAVAFRGDLRGAKKALRPPQVIRSGSAAQMRDVAELWRTAQSCAPKFQPTMVVAWAWGDEQAQWQLGGHVPGQLAARNEAVQVRLSAVDGELLHVHRLDAQGWPQRVYGAMSPLHYGDFGGWSIKVIYAALGLCGLVLIASGMAIWGQRMSNARDGSDT